jgi:hypothetical protein
MSNKLQQLIEEIKIKMDIKYEAERQELKKKFKVLTDGQLYAGRCREASEFALNFLRKEGYSEYKLGKCFVGTMSHWVLYKEIENNALKGVVDI